MLPKIKIELLNLFEAREVDFLYRVRTSDEVDSQLSGEMPLNFKEHCSWLNKNHIVNNRIYIIRNEEDELVGYMQFFNKTSDSIEVGWALHPDCFNKGYGQASVMEAIERAGKLYRNKKLYLSVKQDNYKAIHIYKKYGFKEFERKNNLIWMEK